MSKKKFPVEAGEPVKEQILVEISEVAEWLKEHAPEAMVEERDECGHIYETVYCEDFLIEDFLKEFRYRNEWAGMKSYKETAHIERHTEMHTHMKLIFDFMASIDENPMEISAIATKALNEALKEKHIRA